MEVEKEQTKPNVSGRKEVIKTKAEVNKIEVGDCTLPDFILYYKVIVINTV